MKNKKKYIARAVILTLVVTVFATLKSFSMGVPQEVDDFMNYYISQGYSGEEAFRMYQNKKAIEAGETVNVWTGEILTNNTTNAKTTPTPKTSASKKEHKHTYVEKVTKKATCSENGIKTFTCTCGDTYTEEIQTVSHNYIPEITKESTCTEKGETTYTCSVCGDTYTETIEALGHDYKEEVTNPTCKKEGYTTYTCSRCEDNYKDKTVKAIGHNLNEWKTKKEATMFEKGTMVQTCSTCGETINTKEIPIDMTNWYYVIAGVVVLIAIIGFTVFRKKKNK